MNHTKSFLIFFFIILSFTLFSGCDTGSSDTNSDPEYKIEFTMDGNDYSFTSGYSEAGGAEGCMRDDGDTFIAARNADLNTSLYLRFKTTSASVGTYSEGEENRCFNYNNGSDIYYDNSDLDNFMFSITEYGDVGGIIKGTFSGNIQNPGNYAISNGVFEVSRKADNTVCSGGW